VIVVAVLQARMIPGGGEATSPGGAPAGAVGRPAESGLSPSSYSSSPSTGAYAAIEQRAKDPAPLTIGEAFPERAQKIEVPDSEVELSLKAKRLDGDCAAAVWGSGIGDALRRAGAPRPCAACTRARRRATR
jgi:hypothetical protein